MSRDVQGTKRKITSAALAEFAEHGRHGTTIERIAARANVNKERIYAYYGDKAALFATVLSVQVDNIATAVPLIVCSVDDLGSFAGAAFDYQIDHPNLARLLVWEGMADNGTVPEEASRGALYREKVEAVAAAQRLGVIDDSIDAAHLIFLVLAMASWWSVNPQIARMLSAAQGGDDLTRRRASVVEAATRLGAPEASSLTLAAAGREPPER